MSNLRRGAVLISALGAALSMVADPISAAASRLRGEARDYYPRSTQRRVSSTRFNNPPSYRPAIRYVKLAPIVDGVRMRWERGVLVPRVKQS